MGEVRLIVSNASNVRDFRLMGRNVGSKVHINENFFGDWRRINRGVSVSRTSG